MSENQCAENASSPSSSSETSKSNNNDSPSSCITPNCIGFSKNVLPNETKEPAISYDTFTPNTRDMNHSSKNDSKGKIHLNKERQNNNETKIGIGDKCPSRWLPEVSDQQKHAFDVSKTELSNIDNLNSKDNIHNDNNCEIDSNKTLIRTKPHKLICTTTMKKCDQQEFSTVDAAERDDKNRMSASLYFNGTEREIRGKEAIEELASELNKAATTIQDFSQNVSETV